VTTAVNPNLDRTIVDLELSVRASNAFRWNGIATVRDLVGKSPRELLHLPNFGAVSLKEVTEELASMGLCLAAENLPRVYLAGKISHDDWRTQVLGHRVGSVIEEEELLDPAHTIAYPRFIYGGPFFVACDHSCAHRPGNHGALSSCVHETERRKIWDINRLRLAAADCVFAYIDSPDCYGTLIELGLATAKEKPVYLAFSGGLSVQQVDDFWMAHTCHTSKALIYRGAPVDAFNHFLESRELDTAGVHA
jgi:Bacterial RNA polymerase, alpha chain C terminal domain/Nucleoside 2-deoxyribosyltransferase